MERLSQGAKVVVTSSTGGVCSQLMVGCLAVPDNYLIFNRVPRVSRNNKILNLISNNILQNFYLKIWTEIVAFKPHIFNESNAKFFRNYDQDVQTRCVLGNVYSTNLRDIIVINFISNTKDRSSSKLLTLVIKGQDPPMNSALVAK